MTLKKKIIHIILLIMAVSLLAFFGVFKFIVYEKFIEAENGEVRHDMRQCLALISLEAGHLDRVVHDWSAWDSAYAFASHSNPEFIAENLVFSVYRDQNLNLIHFYDGTGRLVWGKTYALQTETEIPLDLAAELDPALFSRIVKQDDSAAAVSGIILTSRGPLLIAARPILTSTNTGPSHGALVMGRIITPDALRDLAAPVGVQLEAWAVSEAQRAEATRTIIPRLHVPDSVSLEPVSTQTMHAYTLIRDLDDQPALILKAAFPRNITLRGREAYLTGLLFILAMGIIVFICIESLCSVYVLNPIGKLTHKAEAIGTGLKAQGPLDTGRKDEIGILNREFAAMVERLSGSEEKYRIIAENARDVIWTSDLDINLKYVSPAVARLTGYTPQECLGLSLEQILTPRSYRIAARMVDREIYAEQAGQHHGPDWAHTGEYEVRRKDGSTVWTEVIISVLYNADGSPRGLMGVVRDISERKRAEEILKESEASYRQLFENSPAGIYRVDFRTGKFLKANEVFCKYLGYSQAELTNLSPYDILSEESRRLFMERLQKMAQGIRVPETVEYEIVTRTGRHIFVHLHNRIIHDDRGNVVASDVVAHDITARRQAEEALRLSEERLKSIVTTSQEWIWAMDAAGRHTFSNPAVETILGYRPEEIIGRPLDESMFHPEDWPLVRTLFEKSIAQKTGWPATVFRWRHRDGSYRHLESCATPVFDSTGGLTGFQGSDRDITARIQSEEAIRHSEELYRTIFESTATANIIVAEDTTILMANANYCRLCGCTKLELEGKLSWTDFVHADDLEMMKRYHKIRRLNPDSIPSSYEFRAVNRKGAGMDVFMSVAIIPGTGESVVSMLDLTERKRLENQLIQSQKLESVGRLAGGVAHDFNNMLTVIMGNTELALEMTDPADDLHAILTDIENAGRRSTELTRQLLAFARKQTVRPQELDLNGSIAGMLKILRRLIGEDITLEWHPGPDLWQVHMDPSQLDQILANLTVNARDAIRDTGRIVIETANRFCDEDYCAGQPDASPGDYVTLTLSDDGCGIDKETLINIFEPFFTTKSEGQGTGLGLATVYGIVRQNRGFINVYSETGKGTTFRIHLPRHKAEITPQDPAGQSRTSPRGGSETILLVEDEDTVLKLTRGILEKLGYQVLAAETTEEAVRLAADHDGPIDLLLTDVIMPEMNGRDLSDGIRAIRPEIKCLYMSGYTADVIARHGFLDREVQFIAKPFSTRDLAARIREILDQRTSKEAGPAA